MTISISGQVPGKEQNGMYELEEDWKAITDPESILVVAVVSRDGITIKKNGDRKAVMKFDAIEPLPDGDLTEQAKQLLLQARQVRTGETSLDLFPTSGTDDDEPMGPQTAADYASDVEDGRALLGEDGPSMDEDLASPFGGDE